MKKKIIVLVSSDLVTDQRVLKECATLYKLNFEIEIHCRRLKNSLSLPQLPYTIKPMRLITEKGIWMFLHLNAALFFRLLFAKGSIIWSNDLDTLLPAFCISYLRKKKIIYDSHEYYTSTPSLINRPIKRKIWEKVETFCFPKLKYVLTVNESIKNKYEYQYHVPVRVLRNVPFLHVTKNIHAAPLNLSNKKILILQGAGIHISRGGEETVKAMKILDDNFFLIIAGAGDAIPALQKHAEELNITHKILFAGLMPYHQLLAYTKAAHIGIIPEKVNSSAASLYTLPNKLFDYLHAGIPVLSTKAIEVEKIVTKYNVGGFIEDSTPESIALAIERVFQNEPQLKTWKENTLLAANDLCWEKEQNVLINLMQEVTKITVE